MRGKLVSALGDAIAFGLIPAHAGKTSPWFVFLVWLWAHPRACGENLQSYISKLEDAGSSPRMRGKRYAPKERNSNGAAHPRACGENKRAEEARLAAWGSSPRMRGKHHRVWVYAQGEGLIPAHAGKTPTVLAVCFMALAHPRACGENLIFCGKTQV